MRITIRLDNEHKWRGRSSSILQLPFKTSIIWSYPVDINAIIQIILSRKRFLDLFKFLPKINIDIKRNIVIVILRIPSYESIQYHFLKHSPY